MVQKHEVKKLLEQIIGLYPSVKLSNDTAAIWVESLQDISYEKARENLVEHVKKSQYAPTIAHILGTAKQKANNDNYCEVTGHTYELFEPPEMN